MATDTIAIEILADGAIKVTTDPISAGNHGNAEQFLQFMARMAGGDTLRIRRKGRLSHQHQDHRVTEGGSQ